MRSEHPGSELEAELCLGLLFADFDDDARAEQYFLAAVEACDETFSGRAAFQLGVLRWTRGDHVGAEQAFWHTLEFPQPDVEAKAALGLGHAALVDADVKFAISVWEFAIIVAGPEDLAEVQFALGSLLMAEQKTDVGMDYLLLSAVRFGHEMRLSCRFGGGRDSRIGA